MTNQADQLKLIVYDLDGTLVDAFEDIWTGINHALRRHGLPELPYETVRGYVGDGARMLVRRCLGEEHADRFDDVYPDYLDYYLSNPARQVHTYDGVLETLEQVRAMGLQQAILTNKPHEVTVQTARTLGLSERVDGVWGERPEHPRKPHAEALLQVTEHFGIGAAECVMVGDGPADHKVALAAGARFLGVTYGLLTKQQLQALRPDAIFDKFPELIDYLRK